MPSAIHLSRGVRLCLVLAGVCCSANAFAQRANYESVLFGERATGMSGATMALADEPSAVFYNPAGLAQLDYDILGLSVQAFGAVTSGGDGLVRIGDLESTTSSASFGAFPTSAAYAFPLGADGTFALSAVVPVIQDVTYSQGLSSEDGAAQLIAESSIAEQEILIGPSYAARVGPVHLGATVYVEYASVELQSLQALSAVDGTGTRRQLSRSRHSSGLQVGITGVFGALVRFDEHWSAGLRVRFPNLPLHSSAEHTYVETWTSGEQTMLYGLPGSMRYPHPFSFGLGTAYRSRRIHVAFDARTYLPSRAYDLFGASASGDVWDPTVTVPAGDFVANFALGAELFITERVSMLSGVHTDSAATPSDTDIDVAGATTMSFVGVTVGARFLSSGGTFTASLGARHGEGTIDSVTYDSGVDARDFSRSVPGTVQQTSGMVTLSWARSLTSDWLAIQRQLNTVVGRSP